MIKIKHPLSGVGVCIALVYLIPQLSTLGTDHLFARFSHLGPHSAFLWPIIHHSLQLVLTLLCAFFLSIGFRELGFNMKKREKSVALLKSFLAYFSGFIIFGHLILIWISPAPEWTSPLTAANIAGELAFKALLSGTAEEPLFRGLVMVILYQAIPGSRSYSGLEISHAGAAATLLFTVAHIGLVPFTLQISWISPVQLIQAFVLGIFYAIAFDQTKSLFTPILAHNFANFFLTAIGMVWSFYG
ncbi:CPBP family intramembrane glutamic endopeptidase [Rhodohalobacter mucosus]|uniref:CAAX prenyl protease 2/Lysostaphin resistance protein A-like domain-containing protein n=1 Tax=Rhodohalobacter mucosus TaxID=2079485 RepID=A0A316TR39_9BACT|nr:CPBP family intramembrane glutamic endopeptidase [Rhodohalobacter mucosus]PWN07067.1 hypothetical protein DDZ15_07300 [Rhodohalobacter mucosus]